MACAGTQQTLLPTDSDLAHYARSLGLVRLAAWYALERSTAVRAPLSTSSALTKQAFLSLKCVGVLNVAKGGGAGVHRSIYDPLAWSYPVDWGDSIHLQSTLLGILQELSAGNTAAPAKAELWGALADAEIESYLAHLLRRITLDPVYAAETVRAMNEEWAEHSLARRRYLVWSGTRGAAAALLQTGLDHDAARTALLNEMRRRSRWLALQEAAKALSRHEYCFTPGPQWRRPILLEVFLTIVLPIGQAYWTETPQGHARRRAFEEGCNDPN